MYKRQALFWSPDGSVAAGDTRLQALPIRWIGAQGQLPPASGPLPLLAMSSPCHVRDRAIAFTVGKYGLGSLKQLGMLVALFYAAVVIFVVVVLGLIMRVSGFSLFKLLRYLREELAVVFATTSSDSVLPQIMAKLKHMGIRDSTVGLVIPLSLIHI